MRHDLHTIVTAFGAPRSPEAGTAGGLVTGGVDFVVGTVGGVFGERSIVAPTDFNLSDHGGAYMRAFHAEVQSRPGGEDRYVATRVVRPAASIPLGEAKERMQRALPDEQIGIVALVPGRCALVAATGSDTIAAIENVEVVLDVVRVVR
jgi:hypothetical protein